MIYTEDIIKEVINQHPCCEAWTVALSSLAVREKHFFSKFAPSYNTAIVLGHHVVTKAEWTWYVDDKGSEYCAADDHSRDVCEQLQNILKGSGFSTKIVPYPKESGLQFRFIAQEAGAGKIGINAFLLHPRWGPWIHLRVLVTQAQTRKKSTPLDAVCNSCGDCISACPAGAIQNNSFDGLLCRSYRKSKDEYIPFGPKKVLRYCTICADVCPLGQKPLELKCLI